MACRLFDVENRNVARRLLGIGFVSIALASTNVSADERVYEDGSSNDWDIIDNDPTGATVSVVSDAALSSDVIEFAGSGRANAYRLGGTRASNGGWDDTTRDQLSLELRAAEPFTLYVAVQTQGGFRYLIYEPRNDDRGLIGSSYIYSGVGTATTTDSWVTIERDLAADLEAGEPGNALVSVQGLVVRGNFRLDNVALSDGGGTSGGGGPTPNTAPTADAGADQSIDFGDSVTLNASGSSDSDGNVSAWEWRDDQNAVIGTTETVVWTPGSAGPLTATLTVTDDDGATDSDSVLVTVSDANGPSNPGGGASVVYEDGSSNEWIVIDNDPSGATSSIVTDAQLSSAVIELSGAGRANSYRLGGTRASNGGWDNSTQDQLSLKLRASEGYTLYVAVQTLGGFRYLIYEPRDDDRGLIGSYVYNGVGSSTTSGNWVTIERDLKADLAAGDPGNALVSVQGLVVRGNIRIDDVVLSDGDGDGGGGGTGGGDPTPNTAPTADAGADQVIDLGQSVTLNASGSSDSDGNVVSWEWRDDQNAVIGTSESVSWTPGSAGALTATLTVTDDDGATATDTVLVTVREEDNQTTPTTPTGGDTVVYGNGSANEWRVIDNDPSGATATTVSDADLSSDVTELAGAGRANSYRLGGTRASNGGWDDSSRFNLSLELRTSESYTLYVAVLTEQGFRYIIYEPRNDDRGLIGNYTYSGVGSDTVSGEWVTIERDLAADLAAGEPNNTLLSVQGLVVRGNIRIDDVALSSSGSGGGTTNPPQSGGFTEESILTATDADTGDEFGIVVGVDSARAIVGAYRDDEAGSNAGAAYVIERSSAGAWGSPTKLLPSDGAANDGFGFSVDIDGTSAIVGSFRHELTSSTSGAGAAYIYERQSNGSWSETALLVPTELVAGDQFGIGVAIDGNRAIVGASASGTSRAGAAYLFERRNGTWVQTDRLVPSDGSAGDQFGNAVDIQGSRAVVGARAASGGTDGSVGNAGAVYAYAVRADGSGVLQAKISAAGGQSADHFGKAVSVDGNRILVGAYGDRGSNGSTANAGAAYLYERSGGNWVDIQKLEPSPAVANDRFARSLSLVGNRALISAYLNDTNGADAGIAFIYEPDGSGDWRETQQLLPSNGEAGDFFGVHVALDSDYALIGALKEDGPGNATTSSGSVYSFAR